MNIQKTQVDSTLTIALTGRLDANTSPMLDQEVEQGLADITKLVLDLTALEYVSSAGLRVLLRAQKRMQKQGEMLLTNVDPVVMEVLEMTGFADILTIA